MYLAINTASLSDRTPLALQRAAALGLTWVEVNLLAEELDYGYRRRPNVRFYRELKTQLDTLGLRVWSVTAPALTQPQMFSERARQDVLLNAVGAAGILAATVFVLEPAHIFHSERALEAYWRDRTAPPIIPGFDELWAQAANRRLTLALTNQDYWMGTLLTNQVERMQQALFDLAIGWGMQVRAATQRNTLERWLAEVGESLAVAYVEDWSEEDGRPCLPQEAIWQTWLPMLAQTRLKALVLRGRPHEPDDRFRASLALVAQAWPRPAAAMEESP